MNNYYVLDIMQNVFQSLLHLTLISTPCNKYCYFNFTNEETEAKKGNVVYQRTQLVSGECISQNGLLKCKADDATLTLRTI